MKKQFTPSALKGLRRKLFYLLLCFIAIGLHNCDTLKLRRSDAYHISQAQRMGLKADIKYFHIGKRKIRCLVTGNSAGKNLLLLHGSPSSLSSWNALYEDSAFMNTFKIIAVDRPGYGYSSFGDIEISIAKQAEIIGAVMDSLKLSSTILLGSSYGGPVAARIAMNRPQQIDHLIFLSASVKPTAEKTYWISNLMTAPVIKHLFPTVFRISSEEKFSHAEELEKIKDWDSIKCHTSILQGDKDNLIYFSNAEYLKEKIPNSKLYPMKDKGHALIFSEPDYLKKLLWQVLKSE